MLTANEPNFVARMKHLRVGKRVNSRVPIVLEWEEANESHSASGYTVDVSSRGCLAIVPEGLATGQKLRVINLVNKETADAVLIWRGHEGRMGWELGLELQQPSEDFWGVEL